jgi:tetrahydromethanopterin S-methyltransferase subunit H
MYKFSSPQKVLNIGGVNVGGQPGEYPTVLIGSIFFAGHNIISDPDKGIFNRDKAKHLLDQEVAVSLTTGNPRFVDVIGTTSEALIKYIEFVAENTSSPILVDSPSQQVRLATITHFAGTEVMPRLIYNAIAEDYTDEELTCLRDCGVKSSIVLAFSHKAVKPQAKIRFLQDNLLPAARQAGIDNILIDLGVMDVPSVAWVSLAISEAKEKFGYPVGCAPANAIYTWAKMKARGTSAFQAAASAVFSMPRLHGADFILYGSLHNAPWVYPAVATIDGLIAYSGRFTGVQVKTEEHPLYKIF